MSPPMNRKTMKRNTNKFAPLADLDESGSWPPVTREAIPSEAIDVTKASKSSTMPTLYDLPVELKLKILSKLPASEIKNARQVSKHMQALIDTKDNQTLLISDEAKKALVAIENALDNISNFDPTQTDPLQLLKQLLCNQGCREGSPKVAAVIWCHYYGLNVENNSKNQDTPLHAMLHDLAEIHFDREHHGRIVTEADFMERWPEDALFFSSIGIFPPLLQDMYRRVKAGELDSVPREIRRSFWLKKDHERVCKLLGVPLIPEYLRPYCNYGVRSKWERERVMAELAEPGTLTYLNIMAIKEQVVLWG